MKNRLAAFFMLGTFTDYTNKEVKRLQKILIFHLSGGNGNVCKILTTILFLKRYIM